MSGSAASISLIIRISCKLLLLAVCGYAASAATDGDLQQELMRELQRLHRTSENQVLRSQLQFKLPHVVPRCHAATGTMSDFMALVTSVLPLLPDLKDPLGAASRQQQHPVSDETDVVVVGGGSAGSVVAARLSERTDLRVVLLEAGSSEPAVSQVPSLYVSDADSKRNLDWHFKLEAQNSSCLDSTCFWPRGKVLGGTSTINGMMYMRGNSRDYDRWKAEGLDGWGWSHVLPYFLKSEDNREKGQIHVEDEYHSQGGYLTVQRFPDQPQLAWDILAAGAELGYRSDVDLNGRNQTGFTIAQANVRNGHRLSVARAFLHPARRRPNLRVITEATVLRVTTEGQRATGVEYLRQGVVHSLRAKREVVLCAGALQTPQLLLLSGIGPKEHLEQMGIPVVADIPGVGKNLENHVSYPLDFLASNAPHSQRLDMSAVVQFVKNHTGPMTSTGLSQVTAFVHSRYSKGRAKDLPDLQLFFDGALANCSLTGAHYESSHVLENTPVRILPVVLRPRSRGLVLLRSRDPLAPPRLFANDLQDRRDMDLLIDGVRFVQKLANTQAMRWRGLRLVYPHTPSACSSRERDSDEYWECLIRHHTAPENHQCCSARMGPDGDATAVLDGHLRVRGVQGLRVADASAMRHVVSANVNAAVVMMGERAADLIKTDHPPRG